VIVTFVSWVLVAAGVAGFVMAAASAVADTYGG
jgi:hypothetical protein